MIRVRGEWFKKAQRGDALSWLPPSSSGKVIEFFGGLEENFGINLGQVVLSNAYITPTLCYNSFA